MHLTKSSCDSLHPTPCGHWGFTEGWKRVGEWGLSGIWSELFLF